MSETYTLTLKFAPPGTPKRNGSPSLPGHAWYELRRSSEKELRSYGWSYGHDISRGGIDNLSINQDHKEYIGIKNTKFLQ